MNKILLLFILSISNLSGGQSLHALNGWRGRISLYPEKFYPNKYTVRIINKEKIIFCILQDYDSGILQDNHSAVVLIIKRDFDHIDFFDFFDILENAAKDIRSFKLLPFYIIDNAHNLDRLFLMDKKTYHIPNLPMQYTYSDEYIEALQKHIDRNGINSLFSHPCPECKSADFDNWLTECVEYKNYISEVYKLLQSTFGSPLCDLLCALCIFIVIYLYLTNVYIFCFLMFLFAIYLMYNAIYMLYTIFTALYPRIGNS